jgi:hypothetical protein
MLLLLLDALTPERFFGLYTGEKSEVGILTFFGLDMTTGHRSASLGLAARPMSAWCLEWATTWEPGVGASFGVGAGTRLPCDLRRCTCDSLAICA